MVEDVYKVMAIDFGLKIVPNESRCDVHINEEIEKIVEWHKTYGMGVSLCNTCARARSLTW